MGIFGLFGKKEIPVKIEETKDSETLDIYSGMRVEVTEMEGRMLFIAKLMGIYGNKGELHQYSEIEMTQENNEPLPVKIRGYSDHKKKAVYMEGVITPRLEHIWQVENLSVIKIENDRAFFRLETNIDATATMFTGLEIGEKKCKLLNISVGGACIGTESRYHMGDKFMLKFKLLEDRAMSVIYCQVVRVTEKEDAKFEYGCQFLELTDEDQETITQNIYVVQRQKRGRS